MKSEMDPLYSGDDEIDQESEESTNTEDSLTIVDKASLPGAEVGKRFIFEVTEDLGDEVGLRLVPEDSSAREQGPAPSQRMMEEDSGMM